VTLKAIESCKKIAVVIPKYGLVGGAEGHTAELTSHIAKDDRYDVHVFANKWSNHDENITFHKIPIITFQKYLTTPSFAYFAGLQISRMNSFDLIHTHDRIFNADVFTMHGIPHRAWVHEVRKKNRSLFDYTTEWVESKLVKNGKKFIAVSTLVKEKFLEAYHDVDPGRVPVIHPGVDIKKFQKYNRLLCYKEVRQKFNIDPKDITIIFVSMNYDIKGLDYLMAGLARFKSKYPEKRFKLLIVGKSSDRKYIHLAAQLGIGDAVIYTGVIQNGEIAKMYLASDIFAMLSRYDTFGLTVLEAMTASLPVIISKHVGAKDIIRHGKDGFVVSNETNPDEIAHAIFFLSRDDVKASMATEACWTASKNSWESTAKKTKDIYDLCLTVDNAFPNHDQLIGKAPAL
jgi:UDP-glucose:(heptosyl)LPS alpha-1,3-glucosyltransferase